MSNSLLKCLCISIWKKVSHWLRPNIKIKVESKCDVNNFEKYSSIACLRECRKIKKNEFQRLRLVVRLNSRCAVHEFESCPSAHVE